MDLNEKYVTVTQYAKLKNVRRERIYEFFVSGDIVPTLIADKQLIDLEQYKDLDLKAIKRTSPKEIKLLKIIKEKDLIIKQLTESNQRLSAQ